MKIWENNRVNDYLFDRIKKKVGGVRTGPIHASELTQCARRTVLKRRKYVEPSREDMIQFSIGYGTQEYILGQEGDRITVFGVQLSADKPTSGGILECKTTRKSYYRKRDDYHFTPEDSREWLNRCAIYCVAYTESLGKPINKAHIPVVFRMAHEMHTWTVEYDDDDMAFAKYCMVARRDYILPFLKEVKLLPPPEPDWLCKYCEYALGCPSAKEGNSAEKEV